MVRKALERLIWRVVLRRKLPACFGGGSIVVTPDASLKLWKPRIAETDSRLFDWTREFVRPRAVVWDLGANVGLFAFAAAACAGKGGHVLAIEPDPTLARLLRLSSQTRPVSDARVDVLAVAVSSQQDVVVLNNSETRSCRTGYRSQDMRKRPDTVVVPLCAWRHEFPVPVGCNAHRLFQLQR
jgi:FkbM family methyltransferase